MNKGRAAVVCGDMQYRDKLYAPRECLSTGARVERVGAGEESSDAARNPRDVRDNHRPDDHNQQDSKHNPGGLQNQASDTSGSRYPCTATGTHLNEQKRNREVDRPRLK